MCKIMLFVSTLTLLALAGCGQSAASAKKAPAPEPKKEAKYDEEAARLGFPAVFVSQEKETLDWSKAETETVNGEKVQVIRGAVVEVCGGRCDK